MINLKTILVPSDFSECSDAALRYGLELARRFDATLHLLHVVQDPLTQPWAAEGFSAPLFEVVDKWQKEAKERLARSIPAADAGRVTVAATIGWPYAEILHYAVEHSVDLIVMGTHGRGGVTHMLLGSIAEKVIRRAPCPVLTVRHPQREFVEPIPIEALLTASVT
ncbi:MAG TPA: universal stress protein [Vicinamibacterales bacterium]|nr:universal stress protein [Vicinamibacterales bacterium]